MTTAVTVLVGSLRADSVNRQIAERLATLAPDDVEIQIVDNLDQIPFYNEDIDGDAAPAAATALRERVAQADRVLVVTPEYNATIPAVINNAIDWLSRPYGAGAVVGKPFGVIGVTPTPYGGKWAHEDARRSAKIAGAAVIEEVDLSQSSLEVDPLTDEGVTQRLQDALNTLVKAEPALVSA
jgi:NAD(P)H-dependent FMN reductase